MPELPEVQTVVDDLRNAIVGFTIVDFCSLWKKNVGCGFEKFKENTIGKKIVDVKRRAKFILLKLSDESVIVLHLRMTGQLLIAKGATELEKFDLDKQKYIRHFWKLQKGNEKIGLFFHDVRKFATVDWTDDINEYKSFAKLGGEPLSKEFTKDKFWNILRNSKKTIRGVLLDQKLIVGIGNIYVSEILFQAGIYPGRIASFLSRREADKVHEMIGSILTKAIKYRGTTFSDYRDSNGEVGSFQNLLKVYNRKGKRCKKRNCVGIVEKETLDQRSSFWCSVCQK